MRDRLDFIIIGAQKAGTTTLFEYLRDHPQLWLPPNKEAPYFSHDSVRARGWARYMEKSFALADQRCKWGTATPSYMIGGIYDGAVTGSYPCEDYDERTVPMRIRELLPDVRLIAILRDPVQRAQSHHRMAVMTGTERRSFDEAINDLLDPPSLELSRRVPEETRGYVTWGEYGRLLKGYFDVFPTDQLCVVFTSELETAPKDVMCNLHTFLGVDPDYAPANLGERFRVGSSARRLEWLKPHSMQRTVSNRSLTRAMWHALPDTTRHRIDHGFRQAAYRLDLWNREGDTEIDPPSSWTLERLQDHFAEDTERLAELLGIRPPWSAPSVLRR